MEFPVSFPMIFGDPALLDAEAFQARGEGQAELSLDRIVDHCADGLALLLGQFDDDGENAPRRAPRLRAILCALLDAIGDAELGLWQLYTERWIDTAVGGQLDAIGGVVDQPRAGRLDEVYRPVLRGRILALKSDSSWPALLAILTALGYDPALVEWAPDYPAALVVDVAQYVEDIAPSDAFMLLDIAKAAGVRLLFEYPAAAVTDSFTYGSTPTVSGSAEGYGNANDAADGGYYGGVFASSEGV